MPQASKEAPISSKTSAAKAAVAAIMEPTEGEEEFELTESQTEQIRQWCRYDPNPVTAKHVQQLLEQAVAVKKNDNKGEIETENNEFVGTFATATATTTSRGQLCRWFPVDTSKRIQFGTAGLRAVMAPGYLGMNDLVVVQTAQGLAKYYLHRLEQYQEQKGIAGTAISNGNKKARTSTDDSGTTEETVSASSLSSYGVVVGYDHRAHPEFGLSSLRFAQLTVLAFHHAGINCLLLDGPVATPMVPFAMSQIIKQQQQSSSSLSTTSGIVIGIMVTASHNPAADNGYKVYWGNGAQILAPHDKNIQVFEILL